MPIYTLRTTSGREDIVIDILTSKIKAESLDIKSIFHPAELKGYIFIEGSPGTIHRAIQGLMHIRGLIEKPVKLEEIQHFLESKKVRMRINIDDTIEIIGGPFKGEKGKIKRIDKVKDEVTIELFEASIPIPVTIATEFIKVVKRAKPEEEEKPKEKPAQEDIMPSQDAKEEMQVPQEEEKLPEEKKKFSLDEFRKEMGVEPAKPAEDEEKAEIEEERPKEMIEQEAKEGEHLIKEGEEEYPPKEPGKPEPEQAAEVGKPAEEKKEKPKKEEKE